MPDTVTETTKQTLEEKFKALEDKITTLKLEQIRMERMIQAMKSEIYAIRSRTGV